MLRVLLLSLLPFAGNFAGSLMSEALPQSAAWRNRALHAAVGIVFAVVAIEIMPEALEVLSGWQIALAFLAGGCVYLLAQTLIERRVGTGSRMWMIYLAVATDLFGSRAEEQAADARSTSPWHVDGTEGGQRGEPFRDVGQHLTDSGRDAEPWRDDGAGADEQPSPTRSVATAKEIIQLRPVPPAARRSIGVCASTYAPPPMAHATPMIQPEMDCLASRKTSTAAMAITIPAAACRP